MTADLAAILDRAAAFLRALPAEIPQPLYLTHHWEVDGELSLHWVDTRSPVRETVVWIWPDPNSPLEYAYTAGNGHAEIFGQFGWRVGTTVPPEIVAAIRRVCGGGK